MAITQTPQPPGAGDPELARLAQKWGIDMSAMAGAGAAPASDEPLVFFGETRDYRASGDDSRAIGGKVLKGGTSTKTLSQANAEFYRLSQGELIELQRKLIASGVLDPSKVRLGDYDDETFGAYSAINERAARFYAAGRKFTTNDVLGMISGSAGGGKSGDAEAPGLSASERARLGFRTDTHIYTPSDPASLRKLAEDTFQEVLGRKPKQDVMEKFVSRFLSMERDQQAQGFGIADQFAGEDRARAMQLAGVEDSMAADQSAGGFGGESGGESDILWSRLQRMIADAPGKITPGPRSRDYATQVKLWNRYKAGKGPQAAKPGTSKHGNGRANDLTYENDSVRQWALANAHKYGLAFPIYDPKLKRSLDESWHVEVAKGSGKRNIGEAAMGAVQKGRGHAGHDHGSEDVGTAPISRSASVQQVDLQARAAEMARNENPTETRAYEIGGQFENLLGILSKGVSL